MCIEIFQSSLLNLLHLTGDVCMCSEVTHGRQNDSNKHSSGVPISCTCKVVECQLDLRMNSYYNYLLLGQLEKQGMGNRTKNGNGERGWKWLYTVQLHLLVWS